MLTLPYRLFPLLPTSSTEVSKKWSLRSKIIWRGNYLLSFTISLRNPFISSLQHCINITMLSSITINYNFLSLCLFTLIGRQKSKGPPHPSSPNKQFTCIFLHSIHKRFLENRTIFFFLSLSWRSLLLLFFTHQGILKRRSSIHELNGYHPGDSRVNNSTHKLPFYKTSFFLLSRSPPDDSWCFFLFYEFSIMINLLTIYLLHCFFFNHTLFF